MVQPLHSLRLLASLFLLLLVFSCQKENPEDLDQIKSGNHFLEINNNPASDRISAINQLLIWQGKGLKKEGLNNGQIEERDGEPTPDDDIYWLQVGDVVPLTYQGLTLSASHVVVKDNIAYISYHVRGEAHMGAVESIDLTDPEQPVVLSQVFFSSMDVNAIEVDQNAPPSNTKVWVGLSENKNGALLGALSVESGVFTGGFEYVVLSHRLTSGNVASANSIEHAGSYLYVTAGKSNGGVFLFNAADLSYVNHSVFENAKYVVSNGNEAGVSKVVTLQAGASSSLRVETLGNVGFNTEVPIGAITHQNTDAASFGKSNLHFQANGSNTLYVSLGANGIKAFDVNNGVNEVWSSPGDMLTSGNCNSITTANGFLYAANGADGLAVFQLSPGEDPNLVFVWDLEDQGASVNFVESAGDFVFVAKGLGGLKILKRPEAGDLLPLSGYDENGLPIEMADPVEVCETLLPTIYTDALPETQNAQVLHPEFFAANITHNIVLQEDCEVYVTFINEVAGYQNTLGYYYYDADNPPASVDDLVKIIVFPNASKVSSGGELVPGSTIELLGTFNENTVIGFFLISNGWQNGEITNGNYTVYSDPVFNSDNRVQSLIFHDQTCSSTVLCFEDILTSGGDKDFNDVIFQVTTSPASAIGEGLYIQL